MRNKIDTDKYTHTYKGSDDDRFFHKLMWETDVFVGPGAYNKGHIFFITNKCTNKAENIYLNDIVPYKNYYMLKRYDNMKLDI